MNKASFSTWSMSASYPLVKNFSAFSTRAGVFTSPSLSGSSPSCTRRSLTRCCIALFYIALGLQPCAAQPLDALYANREDLASATQLASRLLDDTSREPTNFEAHWQLARINYWLGGHAPERERRAYLERGIAAAQDAARLRPQRPEGHFWTAANMGAVAERYGIRAGLKYRTPIRQALETVLRLDPAYMEGSADRALGRYFHKVPGWLGGNRAKAEQHLRRSLAYNADSTISHYFLAELLIDEGRVAEARVALQKVSDAPLSRDWAPEDRDFKRQANGLLAKLK